MRTNLLMGWGPSLPPGHQKALQSRFRAILPASLLLVGGFYAVFSGTIFLNTSSPWAAAFWMLTLGLGIMLAITGWAVRRWPPSDLGAAVIALLAAIVALGHAGLVVGLAEEPELAPYLAAILVGAGYLLLPRGLNALAQAGALATWSITLNALDHPFGQQATGIFVGGMALGWLANGLHRRSIIVAARSHLALADTLEASEARFRSLAEAANDGIFLLDAEGRITYVNPAAGRLFGADAGDLVGRFLAQYLGPEASTPRELVGTHEYKVQSRAGKSFPAELSLARTERDGAVIYTGVLRNIAERKRAEAESHESAARELEVQRLREMNEFKTQFLNMAAHELNTPLTPLRLQLHLLKEGQMGPLNERQGKAIALLDRNVTRLGSLVAELLEVARLQGGRLKLTVAPVSIDEVIDEVLESFQEATRRVGVKLSYAGEQGITVLGDRNRLIQILFNLVSNAIKFTPEGGRVTVQAGQRNGQAHVAITDTGLGLTAEQRDRLFQPFTQVHDPMAITVGGTGLGLYICKGLVEAQGGNITVSSPGPGLGSTFAFTVPISSGQAPATPTPARTEDALARRLRELI